MGTVKEVFGSDYSKIVLEPETETMVVSWLKDSRLLNEVRVKAELGKLVDCLRSHPVRNIIVDAREYHFQENEKIQSWITGEFMPRIMDFPVKKYAIIVKALASDREEEATSDQDDGLAVEYFDDMNDARKWIKS